MPKLRSKTIAKSRRTLRATSAKSSPRPAPKKKVKVEADSDDDQFEPGPKGALSSTSSRVACDQCKAAKHRCVIPGYEERKIKSLVFRDQPQCLGCKEACRECTYGNTKISSREIFESMGALSGIDKRLALLEEAVRRVGLNHDVELLPPPTVDPKIDHLAHLLPPRPSPSKVAQPLKLDLTPKPRPAPNPSSSNHIQQASSTDEATPRVEGGDERMARFVSTSEKNLIVSLPSDEFTWVKMPLDPGEHEIWGRKDNGVEIDRHVSTCDAQVGDVVHALAALGLALIRPTPFRVQSRQPLGK
ncbi:hypothetical protein MNV49_003004 [Pseudohyphozyma bogoriensis]|nr:hypothetical protein MNV49_003004 [Pseudohyphozyma bogoriensis]